jgi:SulP family sulfate permease
VCTRLADDDFSWTLPTLRFFLEPHNVALWAPALALAVGARVLTHRFKHQLVFPAYFLAIPLVFYAVVLGGGFDLSELRRGGWLFDTGASAPWWTFYTYFSWARTDVRALRATLPTQLALLFFNVLHPPLNVPALAVSLDADVDTDRELRAHGASNALAGLAGTVPNYLVYVNTLLFYRVGGGTRVAGALLALATLGLLLLGTGPVAYIPVLGVGALIFVLGLDLVKEALWDVRGRVSASEQATIAAIMVVMTGWDFVAGVLFGIVVSCVFFVVQNSRRKAVRAVYTGDRAVSTVRRPSAHREYLRDVGRQTVVLRLQGTYAAFSHFPTFPLSLFPTFLRSLVPSFPRSLVPSC